MRAPNNEETSSSYYPYSSDLQMLLDSGCMEERFHPIYAIGLSREQLHGVRNAYMNPDAGFRVGIYGIYDPSILLSRIGINPSVLLVNSHVELTGDISAFVRRARVPVLRIQKRWMPLASLPHQDYYGGVYEILEERKLELPAEVTYMLNLGILVHLRNHGKLVAKRTALDFNYNTGIIGDESSFPDSDSVFPDADSGTAMRKTRSVRRIHVPEPEPTFASFVSKQLQEHDIDDAQIIEASRTTASPSGSFRVLSPEDIQNAKQATATASVSNT